MSINPLKLVMTISADNRLPASQKVALIRAVAYTDNSTGQVHMSQEGIAESAGISRGTVKRAFKAGLTHRYFSRKRNRRNTSGHPVTDYWFASVLPDFAEEEPNRRAEQPNGQPAGQPTGQPTGQEKSPSTTSTSSTTSTTTSTTSGAAARRIFVPSELFDSPDRSHTEPDGEGTTPELIVCEMHPSFAQEACYACEQTRPPSRLSIDKQRELYEREIQAEGLGPNGY